MPAHHPHPGLIIAASVIVAAGLALYESPQVRQWVDQSRRKIAVALHSLGDEIQPRPQSTSNSRRRSLSPTRADVVDERRRRQEEAIRRSRADLIRKAREEGVAVDLDELARLGTELHQLQHPPPRLSRSSTADANRSFDELVGEDGMLKPTLDSRPGTVLATGTSRLGQDQLRFRGRGAEGPLDTSPHANPFVDDDSDIDQKLIGAQNDDDISATIAPVLSTASRDVTADGPVQAPSLAQSQDLIDLSAVVPSQQTASIHSLPSPSSPSEETVDSTHEAQSFHSIESTPATPSNRSRSNTLSPFAADATPTDDGILTSGSVAGSQADDIARLNDLTESLHSMQDVDTDDAMSEAFSEVDAGQSTPGSWTDVGSDAGSEFGAH